MAISGARRVPKLTMEGIRGTFPLLAACCIVSVLAQKSTESSCKASALIEQGSVSVRNYRSPSGEWETTINTGDQFQTTPNGTVVDFKRRVFECDGKEFVRTVTTIKGFRNEKKDRLLFYDIGGKNAAISRDRRTAMRKNGDTEEGFGGLITNRPLWKDETFEVRLDKRHSRYKESIGIGVTYHTPQNMDFLETMLCGTIILYDVRMFENGVVINPNYGSNLQNLKVGDRVGVTRKSNGDLRFLVNGVDLGIAKTNINYQVHGVLDLRGSATQATIITP